MAALLALALLAPWLALPLQARPRLRAAAWVLVPLPLLVLGALGTGELSLPSVLLGSAFAVDAVNRPLLVLAGVGWALAGGFAATTVKAPDRGFGLCWLLTLAGQTLALLAADLAGFYAGYVLMTLAAYGLVIHYRSEEAWRAGRVYLVLALAGEMAILVGLLLIGAAAGNLRFDALEAELLLRLGAAPWLLLAGFAVKLGIVPLHVWLPLAHPVAPVPASAVLSGLLVKAGLLGMLRLLPAGSLAMVEALMAAGLLTAAWGAVVGLTQPRLKTVLAYSTISQMGLVLAGVAAVQAGRGPAAAIAALGLFALHHGLNKIALFLAAGHRIEGRLANLLFALPALALAGLPLSSGALAKDALKHGLGEAELDAWLIALSLSSALTTALLLHAWRLARENREGRKRVHPAWALAVLAGLLLPWLWAPATPTTASIWSGSWPVMLGAAAYLLGRVLPRVTIPEGDLLSPIERVLTQARRRLALLCERWRDWQLAAPDFMPEQQHLARIERALAQFPMVGIALLGLLLGLWAMLR